MPFGSFDSRNSEIIKYSQMIDRTPSALAMKLGNIASLDPIITSTNRKGLVNASMADKAMWNEMHDDWEGFATELDHAMDSLKNKTPQSPEEHPTVKEEIDYTGTSSKILVESRIGQGFFRKAVLSAYDNRCCISGLSVPQLLVASHIVPWKQDATNRLNPQNGLSLSMIHDKAFDIGIITINDDMTVSVSKKILASKDVFYSTCISSFDGKEISLPEKFAPHVDFLAYHRKYIFGKRDI